MKHFSFIVALIVLFCNESFSKEKDPSMSTSFCDKNITNLNGNVLEINNPSGKAQNYLFSFTPIHNNQTISFNSKLPYVNLTEVPYLQYNTSYVIWAYEITATDTIEVQMPPCVLTISEPVTNININLPSITSFKSITQNVIHTTPVAKASYYEFIFTDKNMDRTVVYSKSGSLSNINLSNLKNDNYSVSVKVFIGNSAGPLSTSIQQLKVDVSEASIGN